MWLTYRLILDLCVILKYLKMKFYRSKQHLQNVLFCLVDKEVIDIKTFKDLLQLTLIEEKDEYFDNMF